MIKSILKSSTALVMAAGIALASSAAFAENPMVGGAPMFEDKNIVENAVNSKDHTTLVAAVKAAGLVDTLASSGPFTVFAPVNAGFAALPEGTVETLLEPENKDMLVKVLTAHVAAGNWSGADIMKNAMDNGGTWAFKTVSGDTLTAQVQNDQLYIIDENMNASKVTIADVKQSNGVIHVVSSVLVPK
ncbi:fasciclin domain-containing protein [uncultured Maritalea sp.]|jgi:uncharacterized surface protein with fasciclin (FAS1) repeats|uniref:fasciclin domain-containing protein n=1 Tax=uncultured Maritalea sp. TaxID=757249 RepID=UPI00260968B7|nr:fasciclin domain-containing protein [uncultured Maritalea sp.]